MLHLSRPANEQIGDKARELFIQLHGTFDKILGNILVNMKQKVNIAQLNVGYF